MNQSVRTLLTLAALTSIGLGGCATQRQTDGTVLGGAAGAGLGAIVGHQLGNTGAGAVVGGLVGAITGNAIGSSLDEIEASNRAEIEARLGRPPKPGAVSVSDVVELSKSGVPSATIIRHIQVRGTTGPMETGDLLVMNDAGVDDAVQRAMMTPPAPPRKIVRREVVTRPVIVERHYPVYPYGHYDYHHHHRRHYRSGISFSYRNH
ncbi:MAG: hypothetical protein IIA67_08630 [Planctomycetes bacterium]|nr:hypothetical protein [Planctomycetota bacterium]